MSIHVEALRFSYGSRPVLEDVTFEAREGEFLSVLGPNGVGKSTLFRCMLGLLTPQAGGVRIGGRPVSGFPAPELARSIAYIPQSHNPVFNYSVFDMVLMGTTAQVGSFSSPGPAQFELVERALERLGIDGLRDRPYSALSGGERQLVLIARALAQQAGILVMDEPTASLDFGNRIRVMETVQSLAREGYAVIQSTHDPEQAYRYSDQILALHRGKVLAWGSPQSVLTDQLIFTLYGVEVQVHSLHQDRVRVCVPLASVHPGKENLT